VQSVESTSEKRIVVHCFDFPRPLGSIADDVKDFARSLILGFAQR
jgi:hypothetical protein